MEELKLHLEQYRLGKALLPTYAELIKYEQLAKERIEKLENLLNK